MKRTYLFLSLTIAFNWLGAWLFHAYPETEAYAYAAWITAGLLFIATGLSLLAHATRED